MVTKNTVNIVVLLTLYAVVFNSKPLTFLQALCEFEPKMEETKRSAVS